MTKVNNNVRRGGKGQSTDEIDLKGRPTEELYQLAEDHYNSLSSKQQSKWHSIIGGGGTKKDKIGLMAS